jgi:hypothetical protein
MIAIEAAPEIAGQTSRYYQILLVTVTEIPIQISLKVSRLSFTILKQQGWTIFFFGKAGGSFSSFARDCRKRYQLNKKILHLLLINPKAETFST